MSAPPPDPVFVLRGTQSGVTSLTFLKPPEDQLTQYIAAGTQDGDVLIWDIKTKAVTLDWKASDNTSILWLHSHSPSHLWTQGRCDHATLWDLNIPAPTPIIRIPVKDYLGFCLCDILIDSQKSILLCPGPGQTNVSVWDADAELKICSVQPKDSAKYGTIMQAKWAKQENQSFILAAYENGHIIVWNWVDGSICTDTKICDNPICLEFDDELQKGVCGSTSEKIYVFSLQPSVKLEILKEITIINPGIAACLTRPDNRLFVTGGWDHRIRLFSWKKLKPLAVLQYHKGTVQCIAYSKGEVQRCGPGWLLAAGGVDKSVSLWNIFNN
ncbi:guanine nucleotide-binding protein subunit beta-like protein 1 isoform X2 [Oratosquilla oratoria]